MTEEIIEESFPSDEEFDEEEEEDASDSSSDIDAKLEEDEVFDLEFFKCYSAIKKKDEKIYNNDVKFFTEKPELETDQTEKNDEEEPQTGHKPKVTLLDHQLNLREEDLDAAGTDIRNPLSKSYYEKELEEIKKSIEDESKNIDSDDDDEFLKVKNDGSAVQPKRKTESILNKIQEEQDPSVSYLKEYWVNPDKLTDDEKFLRDYIVNKRYIPKNVVETDEGNTGFFSKNLDDLSDVEEESKERKQVVSLNDIPGEKVVRSIPRNSTKTIRDMVEKKKKREKRLKKVEKKKKKKKSLKNADFEDLVGDLPTRFHYQETAPTGQDAVEILLASDEEPVEPVKSKKKQKKPVVTDEVLEESSNTKKKKKKKRGLNHKKFTKTKVAPDRLLSYGLSKTKLKKLKLL